MTHDAHNPAPDTADSAPPPRMLAWAMVAMLLFFFLAAMRGVDENKLVVAVFFKGLLVALGGVIGYWLDRGLFPYARPHQCLDFESPDLQTPLNGRQIPPDGEDLNPVSEYEVQGAAYLQVAASDFTTAMLRRAIIVAACVLAMALGGAGFGLVA